MVRRGARMRLQVRLSELFFEDEDEDEEENDKGERFRELNTSR